MNYEIILILFALLIIAALGHSVLQYQRQRKQQEREYFKRIMRRVETCDRLMTVDVLSLPASTTNTLLKMSVELLTMLKSRGLGGRGINSDIASREGRIHPTIQDDINDDYRVPQDGPGRTAACQTLYRLHTFFRKSLKLHAENTDAIHNEMQRAEMALIHTRLEEGLAAARNALENDVLGTSRNHFEAVKSILERNSKYFEFFREYSKQANEGLKEIQSRMVETAKHRRTTSEESGKLMSKQDENKSAGDGLNRMFGEEKQRWVAQ